MEDEVSGIAAEGGHAIKDELDRILTGVRIGIPRDFLPGGLGDAEFLLELPGQSPLRRLARLDLSSREFPLQRMRLPRGAAADQNAPVPLENRRDHLDHGNIGAYMYSDRLLDHFQNPRNVGELPPPAVTVEVSNPACGDILRLSARFEQDRIVEARYKVRG